MHQAAFSQMNTSCLDAHKLERLITYQPIARHQEATDKHGGQQL